ncbi:fibronectin [Opitutaceae bacterium TAV5]|nr:fibronectin [Opitutaceae bacterium TAV5]
MHFPEIRTAFLSAVLPAFAVTVTPLSADAPLERFTSNDPYYIYYGAWTPSLLATVKADGYRLVIIEPKNITRPQVADLQNGADGLPGTADDIRVLGYISFGEDNRASIYERDVNGNFVYVDGHRVILPVPGGTGPRVDPRANPSTDPIASTLNPDGSASLGDPSPGGTGYASFYLDNPPFDGKPDFNGEFAGAYVNAGDPAWFAVLKTMTEASDGNCGLDEILTTTVGKGLGCDGIFIDTVDTCAPNSFSAALQFEWTAPGYRQLLQTVRATWPGKLLVQNRGTFFFNPEFEAYNFTTRPWIDLVMFESYFSDSNDFDTRSPYFLDSKYRTGLKLSAEADRADGFSVLSLGYLEPRAVRATLAIDGDVSDWPSAARLQVNGDTPDAGAINAVYAANDADYLYLRISTDPGTDLNTAGFNLYIDTDDIEDLDDVSADGYLPTGAENRIRSELLYQNGSLYSQDTGVFNLGLVGSASVASNLAQTEWEIRIPRALTHPATHSRYPNQPVFGPDGSHILLLLTLDTGSSTEFFPIINADGFEKNLGYRFEQAAGSVFDEDFVESQQIQGWSLYQTDKFLSLAPEPRAQLWNAGHPDTAAPAWSTTANSFVPRGSTTTEPPRVGIQALIPGDGSVTVRWDTASDQTRPVRYKIYHAPSASSPDTANLAAAPWQTTGPVHGTPPANYAWPVDLATAVANEYTVTGLDNGVAYTFVVRAIDGGSPALEDDNTVTLEATPLACSGSTRATLTIDGDFTDWPAAALVWSDPENDHGAAPSDLKAVWIANDDDYLYLRIDTWNAHDFHAHGNNLYFDTDLAPSGAGAGFDPWGAGLLRSELLMQGDALHSQKSGAFNDGFIATVGIAPYAVTATSWEWRIPRNITHPAAVGGGPVFTTGGFRLLVTSGGSLADETSYILNYTFADP